MESPSADFSPREEFAKCSVEYEENSGKCHVKCEKFFQCDRKYKTLQNELYDLLSEGDDLWQNLRNAKDDSEEQKEGCKKLDKKIESMFLNLNEQDLSISEVEKSMKKAVQQLEKTQEGIAKLAQQISVVRQNLNERVEVMVSMVPALKKKKSSKEKHRSKSPRRHSS